MGIEDQFAHFLILGGAFLIGSLYTEEMKLQSARAALILGGFAMLLVGLADRIADHL